MAKKKLDEVVAVEEEVVVEETQATPKVKHVSSVDRAEFVYGPSQTPIVHKDVVEVHGKLCTRIITSDGVTYVLTPDQESKLQPKK